MKTKTKTPTDLKALKNLFTTKDIKNGDLVFTAEIHRVTDINWGRREAGIRSDVEVATVHPRRGNDDADHLTPKGDRIMTKSPAGGQQCVMKLKPDVAAKLGLL